MKRRSGIVVQVLVLVVVVLAVVAGCTRVVETRTTSEIRPMRYAILEVTREVAAQDSAIAMAKRALAAENLKLLREERATGTVEGGPVRMAADGDQPALDATVTITANAQGPATRFRIYASAVLAAGAVGGVDPRLTALVQRVSQGIR